MKIHYVFITILSLLSSAPALAAIQTVTLAVPGMNCAACPFTVKAALKKVDGVSQVDVSYPDKEAVINFDDSRTSVETLIEATKNAGYPSIMKPAEMKRE